MQVAVMLSCRVDICMICVATAPGVSIDPFEPAFDTMAANISLSMEERSDRLTRLQVL
jgi:hypothetical protein